MLETSLGAIARLKDFETETQEEALAGEDVEPPEEWPSRGLIEIQDLTAGYRYVDKASWFYLLTYYSASSAVLHSINLKMTPGQRVAICGRTGR